MTDSAATEASVASLDTSMSNALKLPSAVSSIKHLVQLHVHTGTRVSADIETTLPEGKISLIEERKKATRDNT